MAERIHHPIQQAIEDIWKAGHTPRIQVDARRDDVTVPESIKQKWGPRLVLDLDASWPLNLECSPEGIAVDLAFSGMVSRCTLPWPAIYVVLDRATGRGVVIERHLPTEEKAIGETPGDGRRAEENGAALAAVRPSADAPGEGPSSSSDEEAKRRRARFKVIDGGR